MGPAVARLCRIVVPAAAAAAGPSARDRTAAATDRMPPTTTTTTTTTTTEEEEEEERSGRRDLRRDDDDGDCFDLVWEGAVPPSMETPRDVVVGLARWYCANARPHYSKVRGIEIFPLVLIPSFLLCDGPEFQPFTPPSIIRSFYSLPPPRRRTGRAGGASCAKSPRPTCSVTWW